MTLQFLAETVQLVEVLRQVVRRQVEPQPGAVRRTRLARHSRAVQTKLNTISETPSKPSKNPVKRETRRRRSCLYHWNGRFVRKKQLDPSALAPGLNKTPHRNVRQNKRCGFERTAGPSKRSGAVGNATVENTFSSFRTSFETEPLSVEKFEFFGETGWSPENGKIRTRSPGVVLRKNVRRL